MKDITPETVERVLQDLARADNQPWVASGMNPDGCRQLADQAKTLLTDIFDKTKTSTR